MKTQTKIISCLLKVWDAKKVLKPLEHSINIEIWHNKNWSVVSQGIIKKNWLVNNYAEIVIYKISQKESHPFSWLTDKQVWQLEVNKKWTSIVYLEYTFFEKGKLFFVVLK